MPGGRRAGRPVSPARRLDIAGVERSLAAAWARFGRMELGDPIDGDGHASTTWTLRPERGGEATLRLVADAEGAAITECPLIVARRQPPDESW